MLGVDIGASVLVLLVPLFGVTEAVGGIGIIIGDVQPIFALLKVEFAAQVVQFLLLSGELGLQFLIRRLAITVGALSIFTI